MTKVGYSKFNIIEYLEKGIWEGHIPLKTQLLWNEWLEFTALSDFNCLRPHGE